MRMRKQRGATLTNGMYLHIAVHRRSIAVWALQGHRIVHVIPRLGHAGTKFNAVEGSLGCRPWIANPASVLTVETGTDEVSLEPWMVLVQSLDNMICKTSPQ